MMRAMHQASDYIHPTPHGGRCRVRIFIPDEERDAPVVVVTEERDNPGQSVTNSIERIATDIVHHHDFSTRLLPVFIQHYEFGAGCTDEDPQSFDLVTFEGGGEVHQTLGSPRWTALDRGTVERLVGQPVQ